MLVASTHDSPNATKKCDPRHFTCAALLTAQYLNPSKIHLYLYPGNSLIAQNIFLPVHTFDCVFICRPFGGQCYDRGQPFYPVCTHRDPHLIITGYKQRLLILTWVEGYGGHRCSDSQRVHLSIASTGSWHGSAPEDSATPESFCSEIAS